MRLLRAIACISSVAALLMLGAATPSAAGTPVLTGTVTRTMSKSFDVGCPSDRGFPAGVRVQETGTLVDQFGLVSSYTARSCERSHNHLDGTTSERDLGTFTVTDDGESFSGTLLSKRTCTLGGVAPCSLNTTRLRPTSGTGFFSSVRGKLLMTFPPATPNAGTYTRKLNCLRGCPE